MWAGGSFEFNPGPSSKLRIGDVAIQQTSVKSVEFKKDMIFVNQQRDLFRSDGHDAPGLDQWAVREVRSHVFRRNEGVAANTGVRFTGGGMSPLCSLRAAVLLELSSELMLQRQMRDLPFSLMRLTSSPTPPQPLSSSASPP